MRSTRVRRMSWYGAALALLLAVSTPGSPSDIGRGTVAFAQGTGTSNETTPGTGQPAGSQQAPGPPMPVQLAPGLPIGGQGLSIIDESGDIGEGLSNQPPNGDDTPNE